VLEAGRDLIFYLLHLETQIPKETLIELYNSLQSFNLEKIKNLLSNLYCSDNEKCKKFKKEIYKRVLEGLKSKEDIPSIIERIRIYILHRVYEIIGAALDEINPPYEIVWKTRKLRPLIYALKKRLQKEELTPEMINKIKLLEKYLENYRRYLVLANYKEGFCEYFSVFLCEKFGIPPPEIPRPLLDLEFYREDLILGRIEIYNAGYYSFVEIDKKTKKDKEEVIKIALKCKTF